MASNLRSNRFNDFLISENVIGFNKDVFTFKSGKTSCWYVNGRNIAKDVRSLEITANFVLNFLKEKKLINKTVDAVIGVPEGATLHGLKISEKLIMSEMIKDRVYCLRVKEKAHGDVANKFWINGNVPKKVIIFEDTMTTGGSVLRLVDKLRVMGVKICAVISLVNRCQLDHEHKSVVQKMKEHKLRYYSLTDASSVLPYIIKKLPARSQGPIVERIKAEYLAEYGDESRIPVKF